MDIEIYDGVPYHVRYKEGKVCRTDWIKIVWDKGFLDMKKYYWDKLSQKKRDLILNAEK